MEDQDIERTYYAINEQTARAVKHLNSFRDYTAGSWQDIIAIITGMRRAIPV